MSSVRPAPTSPSVDVPPPTPAARVIPGGWLALIWAGFTVFLFVPRISRRSRVVYAITARPRTTPRATPAGRRA